MNKFPKRIEIEFIPQSEHRYDTVGDYGTNENGDWWFKITQPEDLGGGDKGGTRAMAVLLHELAEKLIKDHEGVSDEVVDAFDISGSGADLDDPGLDPGAPYHSQHMKADVIERAFIVMAGDDWVEYEGAINALFPE